MNTVNTIEAIFISNEAPGKAAPSAPKRASPAFILFSNAERENVKRDHPDVPKADTCRILGEKWKAADADTKGKYAALYAENKIKADEARMMYTGPISLPTKEMRNAKSDPNAPKRACSAFILFSNAERENVKRDHPDAPKADANRLLGEKWKAADADTKGKYAALYAENKIKADEARRMYADSIVVKSDSIAAVGNSPPFWKTLPFHEYHQHFNHSSWFQISGNS